MIVEWECGEKKRWNKALPWLLKSKRAILANTQMARPPKMAACSRNPQVESPKNKTTASAQQVERRGEKDALPEPDEEIRDRGRTQDQGLQQLVYVKLAAAQKQDPKTSPSPMRIASALFITAKYCGHFQGGANQNKVEMIQIDQNIGPEADSGR